jgi:hypothetical protein
MLNSRLTIQDGIEIVTSVLEQRRFSSFETTIRKFWDAIYTYFDVVSGKTCSAHVHVGIEIGYSFPQMKELAKSVAYFDQTLTN